MADWMPWLEIRFVILYQNILTWVWSVGKFQQKSLLSVPFTGGGISAAKVTMCATKAFKASPDPYCTDKWKLFLSQDRANGSALAAKSLQSGRSLVSWFGVSDSLLVLFKKLWKIVKKTEETTKSLAVPQITISISLSPKLRFFGPVWKHPKGLVIFFGRLAMHAYIKGVMELESTRCGEKPWVNNTSSGSSDSHTAA